LDHLTTHFHGEDRGEGTAREAGRGEGRRGRYPSEDPTVVSSYVYFTQVRTSALPAGESIGYITYYTVSQLIRLSTHMKV